MASEKGLVLYNLSQPGSFSSGVSSLLIRQTIRSCERVKEGLQLNGHLAQNREWPPISKRSTSVKSAGSLYMTDNVPVRESQRIESLDVLRGFALLGILLLNIIGFGLSLIHI